MYEYDESPNGAVIRMLTALAEAEDPAMQRVRELDAMLERTPEEDEELERLLVTVEHRARMLLKES